MGAGKKPGKRGSKSTLAVRLTPEVMEFLQAEHAGKIGDHIDETIRKQARFKEWLAKRQGE